MSHAPIFVVAGVGDGSGTGGAAARLFAKNGYRVAVISRGQASTTKVAEEIKAAGGEAAPFPITAYTYEEIHLAFESLKNHWKDSEIRVTLFNAGVGVWKGFLDITEQDLQSTLDNNVVASFAFARESILAFKESSITNGKKGTLLFTGATAALRGNKITSAFSAGKHAIRALSQSLGKEFGPQDIHVAHVIIDGLILTDTNKKSKNSPEWEKNEAARLDPESIAKSYLYLANQDRSSWTWELDLRPAHENW
ncbi:hypothetical protein M422DRAFT_32335 [Sphaerobolus stellatus SS14]|uniref:3-oxoacyl-[acyl-carrier-protein] reductase n=1 Tax=Sphaerobolus stellatus (strain SS14) TaxID=990650 RepID=A0A0C9VFS6_SPHS4|nr:hypothetical protein M422DRAFT_32335 [Sphaerobolus stellatus SS14]